MAYEETFPHHDAHHYANDERQATLTLVLLGLFSVLTALIATGMAGLL